MTLMLSDKKVVVSEVNEIAQNAISAVVADYRGISVTDMTQLRSDARKLGVHMRVVRNTLAKKAIVGTSFECLNESLQGPVFLAFSKEEPGAAAKLVRDFAKENDKLVVKSLAIGGKLLDASQLEAVAKLPTYIEAVQSFVCVMQAPITKFVRTLAAPHTKLVRTLVALRDKMQAAA